MALGRCQFLAVDMRPVIHSKPRDVWGYSGWPLVYMQQVVLSRMPHAHERSLYVPAEMDYQCISQKALVLNGFSWATLLACMAFALERRLRRPGRIFQIRLADVISLMAIVAVLLAWKRIEIEFRIDHADWNERVWVEFRNATRMCFKGSASWFVRAPLLVGIASVIDTAGWLLLRLLTGVYRLLRRRSRR